MEKKSEVKVGQVYQVGRDYSFDDKVKIVAVNAPAPREYCLLPTGVLAESVVTKGTRFWTTESFNYYLGKHITLVEDVKGPLETALDEGKAVGGYFFWWFLVNGVVHSNPVNEDRGFPVTSIKKSSFDTEDGHKVSSVGPFVRKYRAELEGPVFAKALREGKAVHDTKRDYVFALDTNTNKFYFKNKFLKITELTYDTPDNLAEAEGLNLCTSKIIELPQEFKVFLPANKDKELIEAQKKLIKELEGQVAFHKQEADGLCSLKHKVREALMVPEGESLVEFAKKVRQQADMYDQVVGKLGRLVDAHPIKNSINTVVLKPVAPEAKNSKVYDFGNVKISMGPLHIDDFKPVVEADLVQEKKIPCGYKKGDKVEYNEKCAWAPWVGMVGFVQATRDGRLHVDFSSDPRDDMRRPHLCNAESLTKI